VQEARITVVNELDPRVGGSRRRAISAAVLVWTTTASAAAKHRQSVHVPANPLVRAHVVDHRHRRRAAADQGHSSASNRVEQALHVDDFGPRAVHASASPSLPRYPASAEKRALDLEGGRQVRELPLAIGQGETWTPAPSSAAHRFQV
jgi:hypothetical protein